MAPNALLEAIPPPSEILKNQRQRAVWDWLILQLQQSKFDFSTSLPALALLAVKIDVWRDRADAIGLNGGRYMRDANGGSLESDISRAERRDRGEVMKDLDVLSLTVISAGNVRNVARLLDAQGDLFGNPLEQVEQDHGECLPLLPPWKMAEDESEMWAALQPMIKRSGFDFSTAGLSVALMAAAMADLQACRDWLRVNKSNGFAVSGDGGQTYEVSASYNIPRIAKQLRILFTKNGMTVVSCAKNKLLARGQLVDEVLQEIRAFAAARPSP